MESMTDYLIANTTRYPHETIDGETLLIDSETGHLLLISGIGPSIWDRLVAGVAAEPLIAEVSVLFGAEAGTACRAFLDALADAQVVVRTESVSSPASALAWPAAYAPPVLERFDDIANIIAMDPIHDVDQTAGWPRQRRDAAG
jgi:hypothetical protein